MMEERVGYIGLLDGKHKVFYNGLIYTTKVNGMDLAIDYEHMAESRKQRL